MDKIQTIDANASLEILMKLHDLYAPDKVHGQPIVICFSLNGKVEDDDIDEARKFAIGIKKQLIDDVADVEQRNSNVIITPNL